MSDAADESSQITFEGIVSVLKKTFGFIKCQSIPRDVWFHLSSVAPSSSGAVDGGGGAAAASDAQAVAAASDDAPQLAVGDRISFQLGPESKPTKPVAARVERLLPSDSNTSKPPVEPRRTIVGLVATPARPPAAGNAAWAAQLRNGLVRFIDGDGTSPPSATAVRHVAFGVADVAAVPVPPQQAAASRQPAAASQQQQQQEYTQHSGTTAGRVLAPGTPVTFQLVTDTSAAAQSLVLRSGDPRTAFWATHRAAGVTPVSRADEMGLRQWERQQLAVLRLLGESEEILVGMGPPPLAVQPG